MKKMIYIHIYKKVDKFDFSTFQLSKSKITFIITNLMTSIFHVCDIIDGERGNPYMLKNKDYNELTNSLFLFARKFDLNVNTEITDKIFNFVISKILKEHRILKII